MILRVKRVISLRVIFKEEVKRFPAKDGNREGKPGLPIRGGIKEGDGKRWLVGFRRAVQDCAWGGQPPPQPLTH